MLQVIDNYFILAVKCPVTFFTAGVRQGPAVKYKTAAMPAFILRYTLPVRKAPD